MTTIDEEIASIEEAIRAENRDLMRASQGADVVRLRELQKPHDERVSIYRRRIAALKKRLEK